MVDSERIELAGKGQLDRSAHPSVDRLAKNIQTNDCQYINDELKKSLHASAVCGGAWFGVAAAANSTSGRRPSYPSGRSGGYDTATAASDRGRGLHPLLRPELKPDRADTPCAGVEGPGIDSD